MSSHYEDKSVEYLFVWKLSCIKKRYALDTICEMGDKKCYCLQGRLASVTWKYNYHTGEIHGYINVQWSQNIYNNLEAYSSAQCRLHLHDTYK